MQITGGFIYEEEIAPHEYSSVYYSYFWFKYDLGQKYYTPQVRPDRGSNYTPRAVVIDNNLPI